MIFYFSGTGNTRWAAQTTAAAINDRTIDIATLLKQQDDNTPLSFTLTDDETLGFFFPVHGWRPPLIVKEFIKKLHIENAEGHYCYTVCTAGDTVGEAEDIFEKDLAAIGLHVDSAISLLMPESYVGLPFMDVDKIENERRKKAEAAQRLTAFIDDIKKRRQGIHDIHIGRWPRTNSRLIGEAFVRWIITDAPFHVKEDVCIGCGKCAGLCPVSDIRLNSDKHPVWVHNGKCLTCFACYHHCPTHAIEFGERTKKKGQYYFEKAENQ